MSSTPKYRYIRIRTNHFGDSSTREPTLFAIDNEIILFSENFAGANISETDILEISEKIAASQAEEIFKKIIDFRTHDQYLSFMNDTHEGTDADQILVYADMDFRPYISLKTDMEWGEGIGYDGRYELPEEDEAQLFDSKKPEIPAGAIQDQIEYLRSLDEIIAISVWTEDDLSEAIASNGYTDHFGNILAVADEIYGLIGKDNIHKNFILQLAVDRAIRDGSLKD